LSSLRKKRILHIAHGLSSYNNSLTEMLRRLDSADVEVVVASHVDLSALLSKSAVEFRHLQKDLKLKKALQSELKNKKFTWRVQKWFYTLKLLRQYRLQSLQQTELAELFAEYNPDLVLVDMECHVATIFALGTTLPIVLCSRWFSVFHASGLPPMHTSILPGNDLLTKAKITLAWQQLWLKKRWLALRFRFAIDRFVPVSYGSNAELDLQQVAKFLGVEISRFTQTRHWLIPHVYASLPVMSLTVRELEFEQAQDSRMHYVGAMVARSNIVDTRYRTALDEFQAFMQRRNNINRPLVYCSLSTFWQTDSSRISPIIALFRRRSDLQLIVGMGGRADGAKFEKVPENVLIMPYAPQIDILALASVVITHGGISTINEALCHAVPMIVYSSKHVDQDGCMARVISHGVGLPINSDPIDTDELEAGIDQLLNAEQSKPYIDSVKNMQAALKKYEDNEAMVKLLLAKMN